MATQWLYNAAQCVAQGVLYVPGQKQPQKTNLCKDQCNAQSIAATPSSRYNFVMVAEFATNLVNLVSQLGASGGSLVSQLGASGGSLVVATSPLAMRTTM
eukprot:3122146-Amphidinium_carterae.1